MGFVSQRLRDSAKGRECTLHSRFCNHDPATTVLAHLPSSVKGMANKGDDYHAVFACSACHEAMDNHRLIDGGDEYMLRALQRTQKFWFDEGLIVVEARAKLPPRQPSKKSLPVRRLYRDPSG
jgi:Protein of unknown function (DUF1364)